jgi:hypothetical protein
MQTCRNLGSIVAYLGAAAAWAATLLAYLTGCAPADAARPPTPVTAAVVAGFAAPCPEVAALLPAGVTRQHAVNAGTIHLSPAFPRPGDEVHVVYVTSLVVGSWWDTVGVVARTTADGWATQRDVDLQRYCPGDETVEVFAAALGTVAAEADLEVALRHRARAYFGQVDDVWHSDDGRNYRLEVRAPRAFAPGDDDDAAAPVFIADANTRSVPAGTDAAAGRAGFWVDLSVRNDAYEKVAGVVWSTDGWQTAQVAPAAFEHGALPGGREQWGVDVDLPAPAPELEIAAFVTMAGRSTLALHGYRLVHLSGRIFRTGHFPDILHPQTELHVMTSTTPWGAMTAVRIDYSIDGGPFATAPMRWAGQGAYDEWLADLGAHPAGTTIRYAVAADHRDGSHWVDDNHGHFYVATFIDGGLVEWIGNARHWPANGDIAPGAPVWLDIESYPAGQAFDAEARYRTEGGEWQVAAMTLDAQPWGANDHFYLRLDGFPAGAVVEYAIQVRDRWANCLWDNANGANHRLVVNR